MKMSEAGIATAAAFAAVLAVAGGTIGGPIAVDTLADQQPDSPLYALERAGERIKEMTYAKGQDWNLERARERVEEYAHIADKEIPHDHADLLNEAGNRLMNAAGKAESVKGLERAQGVANHNAQVLQRVMEKKTEKANSAVQKALARTQIQERAIGQVKKKFAAGKIPPGHLKQGLKNSMMSIENVIENLENQE